MKYGFHLSQEKAEFPALWQAHFIDYDSLKGFLKAQMVDTNVRLSTAFPSTHVFHWTPLTADESSFDQLLAQRLAKVSKLTPEFVT
ncbi:hypothetical protein GGF41_006969, partial [Coemansia sp. RSA 2531]